MGKKNQIGLILILIGLVGGCGPSVGEVKVRVAPTARAKAPQVVEENGFRIAQNSLRLQKVDFRFDPESKVMKMQGSLEYLSIKEKKWKEMPVRLMGAMNKEGFIFLKNFDEKKDAQPRVGAKVTCLSQGESCDSAFIDVYLYAEDLIFSEQVEFKYERKIPIEQNQLEYSTPRVEEIADEMGEERNEPVGEFGPYVGSRHQDIIKILEIVPIKPNDPKISESRRENQPVIEDAKKETKEIDPKIQAIGSVNDGRLENASDVYAYSKKHEPVGYIIFRPERRNYFATDELLHVLNKMGSFVLKSVPHQQLLISDLSSVHGGKLGRHKSHQNGLDADVSYFFDNPRLKGSFASAVAVDKPHSQWMIEAQWRLFKVAVATQYVDRIFVHEILKRAFCRWAQENGEVTKDTKSGVAFETLRRLIPDPQHDNHFHIRVKCSAAQVRCRQMAPPENKTGCF